MNRNYLILFIIIIITICSVSIGRLLVANHTMKEDIINLSKVNNLWEDKYDNLISNVAELESEISMLTEENKNISKELNEKKDKLIKVTNENKHLQQKLKPAPTRSSNVRVNKSTSTDSNKRLLGTFKSTAYDDSVQSQGKWVGQTATGLKPQRGVIAVDPKVIPLGTKLYIEGYGNAVAGDTGGAIKGNRVDLFMSSRKECMSWGRRDVKVWILK